MSNTPCFKCVEREAGCHSKCQKYITWKEASTKKSQTCNDAILGMRDEFRAKFKRFDSASTYRKG